MLFANMLMELNVLLAFYIWLIKRVQGNICSEINQTESKDILLSLLNTVDNAVYNVKQLVRAERRPVSENPSTNPMDCAEIREMNSSAKSGIYTVWPRSRVVSGPVTVFCDMNDIGGGWTVIQRRGDFDSGKDYFYRDWLEYKNGFGNALKDFWIGNDYIHALTNQRPCSVKFGLSDWEGNVTYAIYDDFWMENEGNRYTMHVGGYRGTAGDSFSGTNGVPFTTKDKDHDKHPENCAVLFKGAWWYTSCHGSNLNGFYLKGVHESYADGVEWTSFRGAYYSLKDTYIMIRPKNFLLAIKSDETPK